MKSTLESLCRAFLGESQARNRYTMYAKIAAEEGYQQIAAIFRETADQEYEHAKKLFGLIQEIKQGEANPEEFMINAVAVPTAYGNTLENLKAAAEGERYEHQIMYPDFAKIAQAEGLKKVATAFNIISRAEVHHEERYRKLVSQVEAKTVFKKPQKISWICRECGYMLDGTEPPAVCPLCGKPHGFYQVKAEEY